MESIVSPSNVTPKLRKYILLDLKTLILHRQRSNQSTILFIDANEHFPLLPFQRFRQDIDLIAIIAKDRTTAQTGTHMSEIRIDYILSSPELAADTIASSILPLNHNIVSDHRAP